MNQAGARGTAARGDNYKVVGEYAWKDLKGPGGYDGTSFVEQLKEIAKEQSCFDFVINRVHPDDGRTFSSEAMESLARATMSFVMARCWALWQESGEPVTSMRVRIGVQAPSDVPFDPKDFPEDHVLIREAKKDEE